MSRTRKTYTATIRMGAAHNDLTVPGHHVHLPAYPERNEPREQRRQKLAILTAVGKTLCSAFGIKDEQTQKPNSQARKKFRPKKVATMNEALASRVGTLMDETREARLAA